MLRLEAIWDKRNRTSLLLMSGAIILTAVDWWTRPYASLGFLYLFPIMLVAEFLPRWSVALLGLSCAVLSEAFSSLGPTGASETSLPRRDAFSEI
jgi:hypothetical protein